MASLKPKESEFTQLLSVLENLAEPCTSNELEVMEKALNRIKSEKRVKENPDRKPKTFFSSSVGINAVSYILTGLRVEEALAKAAKEDGLTDKQVKEAKNLHYYYTKSVLSEYKKEIEKLARGKFIIKNHLNWCKTLPQLLKTLEQSVTLQKKQSELIAENKSFKLQLASVSIANETLQEKAVRLKGLGYTNQQIADMIDKSTKTVGRYLANR